MNKTISIISYIVLILLIIGVYLFLKSKNKFPIKYQYFLIPLVLLVIIGMYVLENFNSRSEDQPCDISTDCKKGLECQNGVCKKKPNPPPPPPPPGVCSPYDAKLNNLTCKSIGRDTALNSSDLKPNNLYLQYYAREPTTSDNQSGGNYLNWIFNQVNSMVSGDILMMQTDFFNFGTPFKTALKSACGKGVLVYLIVDRWQDWGCPYVNNWDESKVQGGNCGENGVLQTYQGKLPANNDCNWVDNIIKEFTDVTNFIIVDLAGGCGGTGSGSCKQPGCPDYENKPDISFQKQNYIPGASARGNPVHAHRKITSFYSKSRNVGSIYKGSMNVQTQKTGTQGVREVGWGITGLLSDPFMKGHLQHDLNCIKWFFPGGVIPDYGYKIKENQNQSNVNNYNLAEKLSQLGPKYPSAGYVTATLNWVTPDFRNIDTTNQDNINWISGVDPNVKVWLGLNPAGGNNPLKIPIYNDDVDLYGNVNTKNKENFVQNSWSTNQKDMLDRTTKIVWDKDNDSSPEFAPGSVWGGALIMKMLKNAVDKKSKFVKIHMYNYFWSSFRPCSDREGVSWGGGLQEQLGYSTSGTPGKGSDSGKTVASLVDPLPKCDSSYGVDSDSWHNNLQPEFMRAIYDYMESDVGKIFFVSGVPMLNKDSCCTASWCGGGTPSTNKCINSKKPCSSNNDCLGPPTDLPSYVLLQLNKAGPQYDTGASKNQWWRWYTLNQHASCDAENPSSGSFCKSHEKLWFTDSDVLIASGHPDRGYYTDFNSLCDDILFENAFSFVDAYNNMYNRIWGKHSVGPIFTEGKGGTGPTNPNWGKWSGNSIKDLQWTPSDNKDSIYPMDEVGCAACFGEYNDGYCQNKNSSSHQNYCMYNLK